MSLYNVSGRLKGGGGRWSGLKSGTLQHLGAPQIYIFLKVFFLTKNIFSFSKRSSLTETTKVFKILALRGWSLAGKCDMLLVNSLLIFISKNLLKVRIAVVISLEMAWVAERPANEPLPGLFIGPLTARFYVYLLLGR